MNPDSNMKVHLLLLAAVASALPRSAGATDVQPLLDPLISLPSRPYLDRGMSRETVHEMFGAPSVRLSPDAWVYFDVEPTNSIAAGTGKPLAAGQQDALLVGFTDGRVTLLRLCDSRPVRAFIARQSPRRDSAEMIASK